MSENKPMGRRQFMAFATWAIGGLISAAMAIPGIAYLISPALKRESQSNWLRLGSVSKVELGTPTLFKVNVERKTGWIVSQQEITAYVLTDNGRDFVALSNVCTHLGCRVRWISEQDQFFCPCHDAIFDREGNVVTGPPPRALDQYQVKAENGQLYIMGG